MRTDKLRVSKLLKLPNRPIKNAVLFVLNSSQDAVKVFVTDKNGIPIPLEGLGGIGTGVQLVTNTDDTITVSGTPTYPIVSLSNRIKGELNSAIKDGDDISRLINDAGYITSADIPGLQGKDAYEVYLEITTDSPPLTKVQWIESLKGNPFTYSDFTPQQLEDLRGPRGFDGDSRFTEQQSDEILELIYKKQLSSITVSPEAGEEGVNKTLTVTYNIKSNEDDIILATITPTLGNVTSNVDTGNKTASIGSHKTNTDITLIVTYDRKGNIGTEILTTTYNTYVPQWAGWSSKQDFTNTYTEINSEVGFQKFIQSSGSITRTTNPEDQYIWFIISEPNPTVYDENSLVQTSGTWGDPTLEFWVKPMTLILSDGVTSSALYLCRSREKKTLTNFTYKIE